MAAGPEVAVSDLACDCHDALWELLDLLSALHCEGHFFFEETAQSRLNQDEIRLEDDLRI